GSRRRPRAGRRTTCSSKAPMSGARAAPADAVSARWRAY
ncbi:MAG: hypothetical protein AVDCRST_MAG39-864, partial [uncultured Sphingomonadaceae bacterium]